MHIKYELINNVFEDGMVYKGIDDTEKYVYFNYGTYDIMISLDLSHCELEPHSDNYRLYGKAILENGIRDLVRDLLETIVDK